MASSVVRAGQLFVRRNCANLYLRPSVSSSANSRFISTSKKNEETATAAEKIPSAIDSVAAKAARKEVRLFLYFDVLLGKKCAKGV
jgi:hypothetical protein